MTIALVMPFSLSSDDVDSESDTDEMFVNFISDHARYLLIIVNNSLAH